MVGEFDQILGALIDARTLEVFAGKFGFILSKKLVDAQIAQIPGAKGLNGQFTDEAYRGWLAQQRPQRLGHGRVVGDRGGLLDLGRQKRP